MNNVSEIHKTKITDLIEKYSKIYNKSLLCLYRKDLFNFVEEIPENWSKPNKELVSFYWNTPSDTESLLIENFENSLKYIHATFFNKINEKLQSNKKNFKTTQIKFNDLNATSVKFWKSKTEAYVSEVESLLRKILESKIDDKHNSKITMILSNNFSNLLKSKSNNECDRFVNFDNLLNEYNIECINHDFLDYSNQFNFSLLKLSFEQDINDTYPIEKINLNLKNHIILLFITKKQDDFKLQIHNTITFSKFRDCRRPDEPFITSINFDEKMTNLSKAKIFAITS